MDDSPSIDPLDSSGSASDQLGPPTRRIRRRRFTLVSAVVALALIGGGVAVTVADSTASAGASNPSAAVNNLLMTVDRGDLLGALGAIVPGERNAIEPGLIGLVDQLKRLGVLSPATNLNDLSGLSLHFSGVQMKTTMLTPVLAAVTITAGRVSSSVTPTQLPLGPFARGLAASSLAHNSTSTTSSASTGSSAIVAENVGGSWYVSLGYTIAVDALRAKGGSGAPPPTSEAVQPTGSGTPQGAVRALLDDGAALDLPGLIGEFPPGEMGALQSYAPLFIGPAETRLEKSQAKVKLTITSVNFSELPISGGELVRVTDLGISARIGRIVIGIKGGCVTETAGQSTIRRCSARSASANSSQRLIAILPPSLRSLALRLINGRPAIGFVTTNENGRWFVSPMATVLDGLDAYAANLEPQDLMAIENLVHNRSELNALAHSFAELELGSLTSARAASNA